MDKKNAFLGGIGLMVIVFIIGGWMLFRQPETAQAKTVTIYKSPTCGCCVNYIALLRKQGYDVDVRETTDMNNVKMLHNISPEMASCHTMEIGKYVVEGHVPFEVVEKMINEEPDIDGIALPDMPAGSPGMPGVKREDFIIYGLTGNMQEESSIYATY